MPILEIKNKVTPMIIIITFLFGNAYFGDKNTEIFSIYLDKLYIYIYIYIQFCLGYLENLYNQNFL